MEDCRKTGKVVSIAECIDELRENANKRRQLISVLFSEFPDECQRNINFRMGIELTVEGHDVNPESEACPCTIDSSPRLFRRSGP